MTRLDAPTATQKLASALLGEPVMPWLERRRAQGMSLVRLAAALKTATRGQVDLTAPGLDYWFTRERNATAGRDDAATTPSSTPTSGEVAS